MVSIPRTQPHAQSLFLFPIQCIQKFFSQTLFDFKKSISGPIELKFSGKTLYCHPLAPNFFFGGVIFKITAEFRFLVCFHGNVPYTTRFSQTLFDYNTLVSRSISSNFQEKFLMPSSYPNVLFVWLFLV